MVLLRLHRELSVTAVFRKSFSLIHCESSGCQPFLSVRDLNVLILGAGLKRLEIMTTTTVFVDVLKLLLLTFLNRLRLFRHLHSKNVSSLKHNLRILRKRISGMTIVIYSGISISSTFSAILTRILPAVLLAADYLSTKLSRQKLLPLMDAEQKSLLIQQISKSAVRKLLPAQLC